MSRSAPSAADSHRRRLLSPFVELTEHRITANGIEHAYLACGDDGPAGPVPARLSRLRVDVAAPAARAGGRRATAPSRPGCAATRRPISIRRAATRTGPRVADAVALHEALGGDGSAVLIGHDWGALHRNGRGRVRARSLVEVRHRRGPAVGRAGAGVLHVRPAAPLLVHVLLPAPAVGHRGR